MSIFTKDKKIGEIAVKKAYALLKKAGYDPRLPAEAQKDYDFLLGDGRKVEVKFDVVMDSTRNLAIEWSVSEDVVGWGQYCNADILIHFYDMDNAIVLDWRKFKAWLSDHMDEFERKPSRYSTAMVVLVPMGHVPPEITIPELSHLFRSDYGLEPWELDGIRGGGIRIGVARRRGSNCTVCNGPIERDDLVIEGRSGKKHISCAISDGTISPESIPRVEGFSRLDDAQLQRIRQLTGQ
ncbi:MAG: hypothetical protein QXS20_06285 [Candidatus Thorarchaeota archaeon]